MHEELTAASGPVQRKAEVVLLKNAVLMGKIEEEMEAEREAAKERALLMDPMLARERRRGGAAFGCKQDDDGPDVHSKAAAARQRMQVYPSMSLTVAVSGSVCLSVCLSLARTS